MRQRFGHRHWWPAETPFEVCIGAILTQNTAWTNVTRAIANLKEAGALSVEGIAGLELARLAELIRPSGYFNQKARRLKGFIRWLVERYGGDLDRMRRTRLPKLREQLLALNGVGPETADSILLYAANKQTFVVDAYTRRVFARHGLVRPNATYREIKDWFQVLLPKRLTLYNDFHAQIVAVGVHYCRPRNPRCQDCPLAFLFSRPRKGGKTEVKSEKSKVRSQK
jgi:endonuclease-3 related protein